jgi:hypothetical protein
LRLRFSLKLDSILRSSLGLRARIGQALKLLDQSSAGLQGLQTKRPNSRNPC